MSFESYFQLFLLSSLLSPFYFQSFFSLFSRVQYFLLSIRCILRILIFIFFFVCFRYFRISFKSVFKVSSLFFPFELYNFSNWNHAVESFDWNFELTMKLNLIFTHFDFRGELDHGRMVIGVSILC